MTFLQTLKATYDGSLAFLVACPLLVLVPVLFELVQHVAEARVGMYDDIAGARLAADDPLRMAFGFLKVVALTVPAYWINRYLAYRDASFAGTVSRPAVRLFAVFAIVELVLAAIQLFVLPQTGWAAVAGLVAGQLLGCLLAAWAVAAPLGNAAVGPRASISIMRPQLPWTFVFTIVAALPLLIPHYVLNWVAIGARTSRWPLLIADSLLVGWLTAVIVASGFFAANRAATRSGVLLIPPRSSLAGTGGRA